MANITAADVNKLRTITGAGMMDCKKALVEAEGDFDLAIENLRKKGQKVAANRSDRESTEGAAIAVVNTDKTAGVVITLNCETDIVGKNEGFVKLATDLANQALQFTTKEEFDCKTNSPVYPELETEFPKVAEAPTAILRLPLPINFPLNKILILLY